MTYLKHDCFQKQFSNQKSFDPSVNLHIDRYRYKCTLLACTLYSTVICLLFSVSLNTEKNTDFRFTVYSTVSKNCRETMAETNRVKSRLNLFIQPLVDFFSSPVPPPPPPPQKKRGGKSLSLSATTNRQIKFIAKRIMFNCTICCIIFLSLGSHQFFSFSAFFDCVKVHTVELIFFQ